MMQCPLQGSIRSVYINYLVFQVSVEPLSRLLAMLWGTKNTQGDKAFGKGGKIYLGSWLQKISVHFDGLAWLQERNVW